jgi:quercetin dioxygenase-like cupin family protein
MVGVREVLMSEQRAAEPATPGGLEPARVLAVPELIQVAPGAIVSRTLVRTGGGNVTAFALDAGQSIAEHAAPFDALVHVVEGGLVVRIGGRDHGLDRGGLVLMPADVPHALEARQPTLFVLTMLREQAQAPGDAGPGHGPAGQCGRAGSGR